MDDNAWQNTLDAACRGAAELAGRVGGPLLRLRLRIGDADVELEWLRPAATGPPTAAPAQNGPPDGQPPAFPAESPPLVIRAPMAGIFYHASEPGAPPFVSPGDPIVQGQHIGIIEAMKLMNAIEADQAGQVAEILAANGAPVELGEPLIALVSADGYEPDGR